MKRFGVRGKLSPQYIGSYEILECVGSLAYRLALPSKLAGFHNVFLVSTLCKYVHDPTHILHYEPLELQKDMSYKEFLVCILSRKEKELWNRTILYAEVQLSNHEDREATWELESSMKERYSHLLDKSSGGMILVS